MVEYWSDALTQYSSTPTLHSFLLLRFGFLYLALGTISATVPPGARNLMGITPGSLMISQPNFCYFSRGLLHVIHFDGKVMDARPDPDARASADSSLSYLISARSIVPSVRCREV